MIHPNPAIASKRRHAESSIVAGKTCNRHTVAVTSAGSAATSGFDSRTTSVQPHTGDSLDQTRPSASAPARSLLAWSALRVPFVCVATVLHRHRSKVGRTRCLPGSRMWRGGRPHASGGVYPLPPSAADGAHAYVGSKCCRSVRSQPARSGTHSFDCPVPRLRSWLAARRPQL